MVSLFLKQNHNLKIVDTIYYFCYNLFVMAEKLTLINPEVAKTAMGPWQKLAIEVVNSCPKIKKEREKEILFDRFGIQKNAKTLHSIGVKYGVTRERIRQIVNNSIKKIQKNTTNNEVESKIQQIESFVKKNGGFATNEQIVKEFTKEPTDANAVKFITTLSKNLEYLKESNNLKSGWNDSSLKQLKIKEINKKAVTLLKQEEKPLALTKLSELLKEDKNIIEAAVSASKEIMKTDTGHFGLTIWPSVNPKSIRDKSRYILERHGKPIHYSKLTEKISDMGLKTVTRQSVHNELIKNNDFVLVGRGIYALTEWGYKPGVVEEVIYEVLFEAQKPLHKNEIVTKVLEKRMVKESTIVLNLQKKRFKRVGKAVYTLN